MNATARHLLDWLFARGDGYGAAAMRIAFGLYALWVLWDLYPMLDVLLGHEGMYGTMNPAARTNTLPLDLLYVYDSPAATHTFFAVYAALAVCVTIGLFSRTSTVAVFGCHMLLCVRNPYFPYGADSVFQHVLFWMMFLDSGRVLSLDAWLATRNGRPRERDIELWPLRAIQIQIALVYLYTGYFKLHTDVWADGSAIWYAVQGEGLSTAYTPWLLKHRELIPPLTYASLVYELSFAVLVFTSYRYVVLISGVLFHLGIDLFMMIRFFSFVMFASYLSYVEPDHWLRARTYVRERLRALGAADWVARWRSPDSPSL
jgi:hypothetical protein